MKLGEFTKGGKFHTHTHTHTHTRTRIYIHNLWTDVFYNKHLEENSWLYDSVVNQMSLNHTSFFLGNLVMCCIIWKVVDTWKTEKASIYFWIVAYGLKDKLSEGSIEQSWVQNLSCCEHRLTMDVTFSFLSSFKVSLWAILMVRWKRQPHNSTRSLMLNS